MSIPISFTRKQPRKAEFFFEQEAAVDRLEEFLKCSSEHRVSRALRAKSLNFHTGHWKRSAGSITHWFFFLFFSAPSSAEVCPLQSTVYDQMEETS